MEHKNFQNQNGQNKNNREPHTKDIKREGGKENAFHHKERDMTGRMEHHDEQTYPATTDVDEDVITAQESRADMKDAVPARN